MVAKQPREEPQSNALLRTTLRCPLYLRSTTARDRTGCYALWSLIAFLVVLYIGNLWGPPPPSVNVLAIAGLAAWLFVAWGYWIEGHRESVEHDR